MDESESAQALDNLMREYQRGNLAAFEALYRALAPRVIGFIRASLRGEARLSDLLQETFLELHRSRHTYLPGHSVIGWAFGIAQNVMLRHRREARRRIISSCRQIRWSSRNNSHHAPQTWNFSPCKRRSISFHPIRVPPGGCET